MQRYQISWTCLYRYELDKNNSGIVKALRQSGARNVRLRYGNGWNNQPKTPTFSACSDSDMRAILIKAAALLGLDSSALAAWQFTKRGE